MSTKTIETKMRRLADKLKRESIYITKNNPNTEEVRAISTTLSILADDIHQVFNEWGGVGE